MTPVGLLTWCPPHTTWQFVRPGTPSTDSLTEPREDARLMDDMLRTALLLTLRVNP